MKYIIILGDGMADEPIEELGGKTPLQAANVPSMDWIARNGRCGLLKSVPDGYAPGSEVANLAILGYDLDKVFEGRGSLEAASMGVKIPPQGCPFPHILFQTEHREFTQHFFLPICHTDQFK